ncbi:MAG: alpha/beta hydrolase [Hyphomicrobiaceae bacterium]|nr:alpha/beta hydrolase [Hyphomicrobiaceae bacterium]
MSIEHPAQDPAAYDPANIPRDFLPAAGAAVQRRFVWGHGWGQNRAAMAALAQTFSAFGSHTLVDFPGFGAAPPPPESWGTAEYADLMAAFISTLPPAPETIWVGHSFGCRVGLQLAARHPGVISRMCLIAGAGLPRRRSAMEQARVTAKIYTYKTLRQLAPVIGLDTDKLRARFGSADYRNAGAMRSVLTRVVNEDLSEVAGKVRCPVLLVYGSKDTETPPEIGRRLEQLIPGAKLAVLDGLDHYSVLGEGRHQVARRLRDFLGDV